MPKAPKVKVSKKEKVVHPNSRKALQLHHKEAHKDRVERQKAKSAKGLQLLSAQLRWFHDQLEEGRTYSYEDVCGLIETYLHRFDTELEEISVANKLKGRKVRPHAAREDAIRMTMERERHLFEGPGFDAPDLTQAQSLAAFQAWNGKTDQLSNIRMSKFRRKPDSTATMAI